MIDPIGLTAISIQQDIQRMNVVAHNSANALTAGFKREYLAAAHQFGGTQDTDFVTGMALPIIPEQQILIDHRPGVPRQTGNPLDIALLGEGYFEIRTDNGLAYTRQGAFKLDEQGYLVTQGGNRVVGTGGDIILTSSTPTIDRSGKIYENGKQVAQIKVVTFDSLSTLNNVGGGLMLPNGDITPHEVQRMAVAQGQLESSNVDSTQEMVRLLETFRHFETSHRVLQAYDDMHDKALRNLGQF